MNNLFFRMLAIIITTNSVLFFSIASQAQTIIKPEPTTTTTYNIKPDYRKCAAPMCGGWFLTAVNQYSLQLETEDEAYQNSLFSPNSIYVAYLNFKRLGLTDKQIQELQSAIANAQVLLRGNLVPSPITSNVTFATKTLVANGAWVSANKSIALGPYIKASSSGIVCITTPCPYFKADIINTNYSFNFHELTLTKAELDREQESQAWQAVASDGLIMTGIKYESQGQVGTGIGVSATKVFFAFPPKK